MEEFRKNQAQGRESIWEPQMQPAELGNIISPMISIRSSFEKLMTQTQAHHEAHLKKFYRASANTYKPLSLQFPALTAEIKLDGERFVIHINEGRVMMNTRNSKWYSELYGPVLGPSLRQALSKYPHLNVILDGEVESWDDINKSLVPFGENRSVAGYRRVFLQHHGMIDPIDKEKLHEENDSTVMRTGTDSFGDRSLSREEMVRRGRNFWLKFRAFDILYVSGSDKDRLYKDCAIDRNEIDQSGSIINLPLLKRKQILYQILIEQENEIEICPTIVIRCNGDVLPGKEYFSTANPVTEFGHSAYVLDSTQAVLQQKINGLEDLDNQRRLGRTNLQISKLRSEAVDNFYTTVVEENKLEGLILKDLASPYLFGMRKFWWKFKPDYETDEAVDIDVRIC
jgi:ATP-dependent DNA ligase